MKNNNEIEELYNQFETVCKVYSDESIGVSLYDKDGYHIISRDNKKTCATCTMKESCPKKNLNLFNNNNTSPELRQTVERDGVAYYEKHIITNTPSDDNEDSLVLIKIKLICITDQEKNVIGYFSINNDTTLYDKDKKLLLDKAREKMVSSLSLNNIISWSFDIKSPIISFLDKREVNRYFRKDFEARIHPDDLQASLKFINDMSESLKSENSHVIRFKPVVSQEYRYYESKSRVILDNDNKPKTIVGTYRDITEYYIKRQKIEDTQKVLDTILNESAIMVWDYELSTKKSRIYNDNIFSKKSEYNQIVHDCLKDVSKYDLEKLTVACKNIASGIKEKEDLIINIKTTDGAQRIVKCHITYRKNDINVITHIVGSLIDITSQLERERKEKEKNAMVDLILKTEGSNAWYYPLKDKVFHMVLGGNFLGTNGKTIEEVAKMMTPKSGNECHSIMSRLIDGTINHTTIISEFIKPDDGSIRFIRNAFVVITDENKNITGVLGSQKDITEEEQKKRSLKKYQINSEIVNRVAQIIYWEYDLTTKLLYTRGSKYNDGKPMDEEKFLTYVHPDDKHLIKTCVSAMDNLMEDIEPFEIRCMLSQYSDYRWMKFYVSPVRDNGKITSYTGIRRDTNDERLNSLKLERLNSQINQVMYMSEIAPFIWNPQRDEFYFTSDALLNKENENFNEAGTILRFKQVLASIHPDDQNMILDIFNKIIAKKQDRGWCKVRYDKSHKFLHTYIVSIIPDESNLDERAFIGYLQDITNHELLTKRLIDEKLKAEESEKLKSNFLANMSHEIRTPLNAIVGFSSLLADTESKDEMNEYSNIIQKNSDMLLQLINEIIEISRIDAGRTERFPQKFNLNELFKENYMMQKELIKIPGVIIKIEIPDKNLIVNLDRRRTTELLNNFMSNASKYTQKGYIKMGFNILDNNRLRLFVEDTGCGIAQENKEKIFGRFEKLNSFVQGAGLGMSICQHYVKDAGGNIWVDSELGKGSKFYVELNYK